MHNCRVIRVFVPVRLALASLCLSPAALPQVAVLQITVVEGEGIVHVPGSRISRPLTVEITDETGKPVADAAVTFHVPDEGPGGNFPNGLRTAVVTTDLRGRASLRGLQVNRIPGRFQIRIFVSKEQARAGTVSFQYIAETGSGAAKARTTAPPVPAPRENETRPAPASSVPPVAQASKHRRSRWFTIGALAAAGAASGFLAAGRAGTNSTTGSPSTLSIGTPTVVVGKP